MTAWRQLTSFKFPLSLTDLGGGGSYTLSSAVETSYTREGAYPLSALASSLTLENIFLPSC